MFDNIGQKIKNFARTYAIIGMVACVILGLIIMFTGMTALNGSIDVIIYGLLIAIIGSVFCYISVFVLYAFGQLVENSDKLVKALVPQEPVAPKTPTPFNSTKTIPSVDYSGKSWNENIKQLSTEELENRINSPDWQDSYKALCKTELDSRRSK